MPRAFEKPKESSSLLSKDEKAGVTASDIGGLDSKRRDCVLRYLPRGSYPSPLPRDCHHVAPNRIPGRPPLLLAAKPHFSPPAQVWRMPVTSRQKPLRVHIARMGLLLSVSFPYPLASPADLSLSSLGAGTSPSAGPTRPWGVFHVVQCSWDRIFKL